MRKQRWIPVKLIEKAERIASYIREEQEKGNLLDYPPNITGAQVLIMALAKGLVQMAQEVGVDFTKETVKSPEKTEGGEDRKKTRSFLEELIGK